MQHLKIMAYGHFHNKYFGGGYIGTFGGNIGSCCQHGVLPRNGFLYIGTGAGGGLVVLYIGTGAGTMSAHTFCGTLLMLTNQMASVNENEQNHSAVIYLHQSKQN